MVWYLGPLKLIRREMIRKIALFGIIVLQIWLADNVATWRTFGEHFHWQRTENGLNSGNHWKRGEKNASLMYWMYRVMKSEPQTSSLKEHFKRRTFDMYMVRPRRLWEHPVLFIVSTCTSTLAHRGDCRYPSSCSFVLILDVQLLWYPELFNHNIGDIFKLFENQGLSNCGVIFRVILTHVSIHRNLRDVLNAEMLFTCQIILIVPPMSFLMSDNEFCTEQHHEHGFGNRTISCSLFYDVNPSVFSCDFDHLVSVIE